MLLKRHVERSPGTARCDSDAVSVPFFFLSDFGVRVHVRVRVSASPRLGVSASQLLGVSRLGVTASRRLSVSASQRLCA